MGIAELVQKDYVIWEPWEAWQRENCWRLAEFAFLFSGTGSGKTTFALRTLALSGIENNCNVLYLVPRAILKEQIENDMRTILDEYPTKTPEYNEKFTVWTYQYLEELLSYNKRIPEFNIIICDEFHYFISDSIFNRNTQLSYDNIFHNDSRSCEGYDYDNCDDDIYYYNRKFVTLLLTATPDDIMEYIINDINFRKMSYITSSDEIYEIFCEPETSEGIKLEYRIKKNSMVYIYKSPKNYDYLNIKYLTGNKESIEIIEVIKNTKGKSIVFISSKRKGNTIKEELRKLQIDSAFITADNKDEDARKTVEELTCTNTFSEKVLITTSVLDVGVNILSKGIENIIIAATEPMEFLQMLGRIRIVEPNQKITLFIFKRSAKYFQNLRKNIIEKIKCCEYLENHQKGNFIDILQILQEELRLKSNVPDGYKNFLYSDGKNVKLNKLAAYRLRQLHILYDEIFNGIIRGDENYFIKKQLEWLGYGDDYSDTNFYFLELRKKLINELYTNIENRANKIKDGVFKKDCANILDEFKPFIINISKLDKSDKDKAIRNNLPLSIKKFNKFCDDYKIPYNCISRYDKIKRRSKYYLEKLIYPN